MYGPCEEKSAWLSKIKEAWGFYMKFKIHSCYFTWPDCCLGVLQSLLDSRSGMKPCELLRRLP